MLKLSLINAAAVIAVLASLSASAPAQTAPATAPACPASFRPIANFCFDEKTANIVMPDAPAKRLVFTDADCKPGYTIMMAALCFNRATGDVVLANVPPKAVASK